MRKTGKQRQSTYFSPGGDTALLSSPVRLLMAASAAAGAWPPDGAATLAGGAESAADWPAARRVTYLLAVVSLGVVVQD